MASKPGVCDIQIPKEKLLQWSSVMFYRWNSINMSDFLLMCLFMFRPDSLMIMQDVKLISKHCVCRTTDRVKLLLISLCRYFLSGLPTPDAEKLSWQHSCSCGALRLQRHCWGEAAL